MKELLQKLKRRSGVIALGLIGLFVILNPTAFITLGGDAGYKLFTATWALILFHLAITQADRHWSHPDRTKNVSLSNFMNDADANQRMVIYASLFVAVAVVLAAVIIS